MHHFSVIAFGALLAYSNAFESPESTLQLDWPPVNVLLSSPNRDEIVTVSVLNIGAESLKMLPLQSSYEKYGLNASAVWFDVTTVGDSEVKTPGKLPAYRTWDGSNFITIESGKTFQRTFNLSTTYELHEGGEYLVGASVSVVWASVNSTSLSGVHLVESNDRITISVNLPTSTREAHPPILKIALFNCTETFCFCDTATINTTKMAIENARAMADGAASFLESGSTDVNNRFQRYFSSISSDDKATVANNYRQISKLGAEVLSGTSSNVYFCQPTKETETTGLGACNHETHAYAVDKYDFIVNCPLYYQTPDVTTHCCQDDQQSITLRQLARLLHKQDAFMRPLGCGNDTVLPKEIAMHSSYSHAYFAHAVRNQC